MKKILAFVFMMMAAANVFAQKEKVSPAYWVVETNVNQKNYSIVRLYDASNNLVHEVKMKGMYFNVVKRKHQRMLNELLKGYYHNHAASARRSIRSKNKL